MCAWYPDFFCDEIQKEERFTDKIKIKPLDCTTWSMVRYYRPTVGR